MQTSAGTGQARYLTQTLTAAHTHAPDHRTIDGASPQQWHLMHLHRDLARTVDDLLAKFGEAQQAAPKRHVLQKFLVEAPPPPQQPGTAPKKLTRGAMEAFLKSRAYTPDLLRSNSTRLFVIDYFIKEIDPDKEAEPDDWLVAMTCGAYHVSVSWEFFLVYVFSKE